MKSYKLNYYLSKKIYKHHKQKIYLNRCYMNIYLLRNCMELNKYLYTIAYGFLLHDGIYTRHCFILLSNGTVIDPTIFIVNEKYDFEYFIIKDFTLMEYMQQIIANDYDLSFVDLLINKEIELHDELKKQGYERNICEYEDFMLKRE